MQEENKDDSFEEEPDFEQFLREGGINLDNISEENKSRSEIGKID